METMFEIDAIKVEKYTAMRRYRTFQKLANIIRTLEIFAAIALISISVSWTSSHLPTALRFSGEFFRRISSLMFSPLFVFILGNVIVITLFANSSSSSDHSGETSPENDDVKFVADVVVDFPAMEAVVAAAEKKEKKEYRRSQSSAIVDFPAMEAVVAAAEKKEKKEYRRSQSSAIVVAVPEKKDLRRSTTVPRRKIGSDEVATEVATEAAVTAAKCSEQEELSDEDFNRKVEEFIEKQRKFLSEESKILVVSSNNN